MGQNHEMPEDPVSPVPLEVYPMVPSYLARREADVTQMKYLLVARKFDEIRFIAHQLKGSGGGYGLNIISEIGQELELAAKNKDSNEVHEMIEQLSKAVKYLKPHFRV
jgi:HPt (histidine-containing phosphotransfer) domain-containing protein